jgi:hypothetical protein
MNEQPMPYQYPGRRSKVRSIPVPVAPPVTLSPLVKGMVTGTLGNVPLTSDVYAQLATALRVDTLLAWVSLIDTAEVLGLLDDRPVRTSAAIGSLPQLILTDGAR